MKRSILVATVVSLSLSCFILSSNLILQAQEADSGPNATPVRDSLTPVSANVDPLDIYKEAGINKEQEDKIRRMAKEFEDQQKVRLKRLLGYIEDMQELQMKPDASETEVMGKQSQINSLNAEIANNRIKLLLDIRSLMQPEQKEKLVVLIKERKARAKARRANNN